MKHKLLREDILPAMASNRKVQRLLNEFMDLLSEYENVEITGPKTQSAPRCQQQAGTMISTLSTTNHMDPDHAATERKGIITVETDQEDPNRLVTCEGNSAAPTTNQVDLDPPVLVQTDLVPQAKE